MTDEASKIPEHESQDATKNKKCNQNNQGGKAEDEEGKVQTGEELSTGPSPVPSDIATTGANIQHAGETRSTCFANPAIEAGGNTTLSTGVYFGDYHYGSLLGMAPLGVHESAPGLDSRQAGANSGTADTQNFPGPQYPLPQHQEQHPIQYHFTAYSQGSQRQEPTSPLPLDWQLAQGGQWSTQAQSQELTCPLPQYTPGRMYNLFPTPMTPHVVHGWVYPEAHYASPPRATGVGYPISPSSPIISPQSSQGSSPGWMSNQGTPYNTPSAGMYTSHQARVPYSYTSYPGQYSQMNQPPTHSAGTYPLPRTNYSPQHDSALGTPISPSTPRAPGFHGQAQTPTHQRGDSLEVPYLRTPGVHGQAQTPTHQRNNGFEVPYPRTPGVHQQVHTPTHRRGESFEVPYLTRRNGPRIQTVSVIEGTYRSYFDVSPLSSTPHSVTPQSANIFIFPPSMNDAQHTHHQHVREQQDEHQTPTGHYENYQQPQPLPINNRMMVYEPPRYGAAAGVSSGSQFGPADEFGYGSFGTGGLSTPPIVRGFPGIYETMSPPRASQPPAELSASPRQVPGQIQPPVQVPNIEGTAMQLSEAVPQLRRAPRVRPFRPIVQSQPQPMPPPANETLVHRFSFSHTPYLLPVPDRSNGTPSTQSSLEIDQASSTTFSYTHTPPNHPLVLNRAAAAVRNNFVVKHYPLLATASEEAQQREPAEELQRCLGSWIWEERWDDMGEKRFDDESPRGSFSVPN
ncbi:hypothetical protein G7Y89_g3387 [Cudoniella acicularis]|uniref:Uncharacterized protein n=1 Tax=Cudoniella acicularis TaxID=354080 RepID=A0A8H4RUG3_9HELO|nr:hypothetical protein G7Y89_g3387 [Cudoniella acicularis]